MTDGQYYILIAGTLTVIWWAGWWLTKPRPRPAPNPTRPPTVRVIPPVFDQDRR